MIQANFIPLPRLVGPPTSLGFWIRRGLYPGPALWDKHSDASRLRIITWSPGGGVGWGAPGKASSRRRAQRGGVVGGLGRRPGTEALQSRVGQGPHKTGSLPRGCRRAGGLSEQTQPRKFIETGHLAKWTSRSCSPLTLPQPPPSSVSACSGPETPIAAPCGPVDSLLRAQLGLED